MLGKAVWSAARLHWACGASPSGSRALQGARRSERYFEEIRVFKAGMRLDTLAWNNRIGLWLLFCWFEGRSND